MGGSKLGRGGETSATSAVSLTWESRGRERVFCTHSLSSALKAQPQLFLSFLLRRKKEGKGQGRKVHVPMRPASCSWILSISMGVVTITWQVPAPQPASISLSSVSFFLPEEKRESPSEQVAWNNIWADEDKAWGTSLTLEGHRKGSQGAAEPARPDSSAWPSLGISASTT